MRNVGINGQDIDFHNIRKPSRQLPVCQREFNEWWKTIIQSVVKVRFDYRYKFTNKIWTFPFNILIYCLGMITSGWIQYVAVRETCIWILHHTLMYVSPVSTRHSVHTVWMKMCLYIPRLVIQHQVNPVQRRGRPPAPGPCWHTHSSFIPPPHSAVCCCWAHCSMAEAGRTTGVCPQTDTVTTPTAVPKQTILS